MPASCASRIASTWLSERGITDGPLWQCRSMAPCISRSITSSGTAGRGSIVFGPGWMWSLMASLLVPAAAGDNTSNALAQSAEQAVREEQQHDKQNGQRHDVLIASADHDDGGGLHHAEQYAADERGRRAAEAANDRRD